MEENIEYSDNEKSLVVSRYDKMLKENNAQYFDIDELDQIIDFYSEKFELKRASEVIDYALKLHPGTTSFLLKKAHIMINEGQYYTALTQLKNIARKEPSNNFVYFLKGLVYNSLGEISRALKNFEKSVFLTYEPDEELFLNIASALQQTGQYEFAANYYKKVCEIDKENTTATFELAFCYEKINKNHESIELYKWYLASDPYSKLAWFNLAELYNKTEDYEAAIDALEFVLAIDPTYKHAVYQKALNEVYAEKIKEGINTFKEYLIFEPTSASAFYHIGESYAKLKKYREALDHFSKALQLDNSMSDAHYGQAFILYSEKKYTDAYYSIKQAIKLDKSDPDFWHLSALINQALGFINEADIAFKTAIELENSDPQIWIDYSKLEHAHKNLSKRINILSQAFEFFSDNAEINYRLAGNLALVSNIDSAAIHLEIALSAAPEKIGIFRSIFAIKENKLEEIIEKFTLKRINPF
ncbi:MAG: tetratricopeptide repeat protein [Bacteroidales bacterium]